MPVHDQTHEPLEQIRTCRRRYQKERGRPGPSPGEKDNCDRSDGSDEDRVAEERDYLHGQRHTAFGVVDVAFKGTGVMRPCTAGEPVCARVPALGQKGGCLFGSPSYTSQNPKIPDTLPPAAQRVTASASPSCQRRK